VPVPLSILVVFSEPMDSTTLHPATVQLLRNGYVVPGRVEVADDLLAVSFTPAEALALNAAYVLNVDSQVSDLDGEVLRGSEQVDFTTTSEPSPLAGEYVRVTPWFFPGDAPRVVLNADYTFSLVFPNTVPTAPEYTGPYTATGAGVTLDFGSLGYPSNRTKPCQTFSTGGCGRPVQARRVPTRPWRHERHTAWGRASA
jgi:hypothetical protein